MPRVLITTLYVLPRREIASWYDSSCKYPILEEAKARIADWANVPFEEVGYAETAGGEFFTVDDEPAGFIESRYSSTDAPAQMASSRAAVQQLAEVL